MTLQDVATLFQGAFSMLTDNKLLGIPLLAWFVISAMLGLIGLFIKGTKK